MYDYNVAVTGLNATDNPAPGIAVNSSSHMAVIKVNLWES